MNTNADLSKDKQYYKTKSPNISSDSSSELNVNSYSKEKLNPVDLPKSATEYVDDNDNLVKIQVEDLLPSQSNPYFNVRVKTVDNTNYPMTDQESFDNPHLYEELSAIKLIENPRGASMYSPEDFLYIKNYDSLKLNRLVTLRRFAHPVMDDIFSNFQEEPDIARILCYSDQDTNKLSDILGFNLGLNWKNLESTSEKANMEGTDSQSGISGIAGSVLRFVDPKYGQEEMMGAGRVNYDPQHDSNRVYGPVDSIASTHIRDIGVKFSQSINLEFAFEMKSHNGINQKAAFIDLLSNLILICTNDAKFWGGARYWVGPKPSKYMKDLKALDSKNWQEFVGKSMKGFKQFLAKFDQKGSAKEMLKNIANNAMNIAFGKLLNTLGRTGIPVMNSLLTGNPVGMWHITIGNPLNPILVAGDLIIDDANITFGDELGYDDFPTEIKLNLTLKHAKPRGRAEIENMFNCGQSRTYLKPKDVMKNNKNSSKENPETLSNTQNKNKESRFGEFDSAAIERNAREVWSFLTDK